jgi:hypothetical protein
MSVAIPQFMKKTQKSLYGTVRFTPLCKDHAEDTASLLLLIVFTAPLHDNGIYLIVACVFFVAGMCLPSRCLAMNIYSDFTIPAFGRHVTV